VDANIIVYKGCESVSIETISDTH